MDDTLFFLTNRKYFIGTKEQETTTVTVRSVYKKKKPKLYL